MRFDFTTILERKGMDAIAVDALGQLAGFAPDAPQEGFDAIPMWVADMNFPTAPSIVEAISQRLAHPAYGYFDARQEYFDAIVRWHKERNGVQDLSAACIGYENGVLGGVISALNVLCSRGDRVLVHSPTYIGFTNSLKNNGYDIVHSPLIRDEAGVWRMDLKDMERKLQMYDIHVAIFCSPHNPCGRVWTPEELKAAMALFERYRVKVISDEIWSDLILNGHKHTPTQSVSEYAKMNTVALYAPSKTFNLAGLVGSYHIIYDPVLRSRVRKESSLSHYNSMNVLSMYALIGAYSEVGTAWLEELRQVLSENVAFTCEYIQKNFHGIECFRPEGTYMLFLDCSEWCRAHGKSLDALEKEAWRVGVAVQDGRMFHGPCHLRLNLALPRSRIGEALERLKKYVLIG
ncbi:MAG: aminotransferase class I/II-fold pyridoxal phosphate-dependent enzyme [Ruminococcaceae bacterium]|nr:aminotransferase class I/II-fold pyridoxal phosphate-dependent enzyme [Oscillospiraceae bacterium]